MMTRHLGDHVSTVYVAVIPILSAAMHAAPKLFIASLRSLQTMGMPFYAAAAIVALGCAGLAFLAIWLAFRAVTALLAALGRGFAAARNGAASIRMPSFPGKAAPAAALAPISPDHPLAEPYHPLAEPFVPSWSPGASAAAAAAPQPERDDSSPAAAPPHRFPSRPTPASVAAAASGIHERLADLTNPLVQEDVPPGFLYVDTSPLGHAAAAPEPASRTAREVGMEPVTPDVALPDFPAGTIPFPSRPPSSAPMSIEEAIKFASELQEARDRGALERMIARGGRPAVAS